MKVESKEKEFQPVTITLETQKELDDFWHILDCATGKTLNEYCWAIKIPEINKSDYWDALDNAIHSRGKT